MFHISEVRGRSEVVNSEKNGMNIPDKTPRGSFIQKIDRAGAMRDTSLMTTATLKSELHEIADHLPDTASYNDAMYELYVHMKVAKGRQAAEEGRVVPHDEVKRRFSK